MKIDRLAAIQGTAVLRNATKHFGLESNSEPFPFYPLGNSEQSVVAANATQAVEILRISGFFRSSGL
jgi:hypothetical protein